MPFRAGSSDQFCKSLIFQEPTKNDLAVHDFLQGFVLFTTQKQNVCDPFPLIFAEFKDTSGVISRDKMPFGFAQIFKHFVFIENRWSSFKSRQKPTSNPRIFFFAETHLHHTLNTT